MKFHKLVVVAAIAALSMNTGLSALSYDFNLGGGGGIHSSLFLSNFDGTSLLEDKLSFFSWNAGGFIGGGLAFGEEGPLTNSVGLEYSAYYREDSVYFSDSHEAQNLDVGSLAQNLDVYYKIDIMKGIIPIDFQLNLGFASRIFLNYGYNNQKRMNFENDIFGVGLHTGIRFNVHMLFVSMDYTYIPEISGAKTNEPRPANYYGLNEHAIGVTLGVMINKAVLNSFMGMGK